MTTFQRISKTQLWLTVIFVTAMCVSNIITVKQMQLPFGITLPCGALVFPITYILSDVFSEVYGYKYSRHTCYLAFAMNVVFTAFLYITLAVPAPVWWGNQDAFVRVFVSTPRVLLASFIAYLVGDFANDRLFRFVKVKQGGILITRGFTLRALLSSMLGEVFDTGIFLFGAFLGTMPLAQLWKMFAFQWAAKIIYEIIILPVTCQVVKFARKAER